MTSGKSFITAFTSSSPRQPIDPVGQESKARIACRRSSEDTGCVWTKDVPRASPKTAGAVCRHASQSMQVESTKKSPGTFSATRFLGFAITSLPSALPPFYGDAGSKTVPVSHGLCSLLAHGGRIAPVVGCRTGEAGEDKGMDGRLNGKVAL